MVPLKILMVGFAWQLGALVFTLLIMIYLGFKFYRKLKLPTSWPWILGYAFGITFVTETLHILTYNPETKLGLDIEVLLPAFLIGCMLRPHAEDEFNHEEKGVVGVTKEIQAGLYISAAFMFLVGLSMPAAFGEHSTLNISMSPWMLALHVLLVTVVSNLGKMFVCFSYKKEATFKERVAVAVAMFPRGEVGAGVLAVSLSYGIAGPFVAVAFLSLAFNLVLTGLFIYIVKLLLK